MGLRNAGALVPVTAVSAVAVLAALAGDAAHEWLAWQRSGIAAGEVWRLASGHFVHLGWSHLVLNLVGLWLVWYLVAAALPALQWLFVTAVVIAGLDVGLWLWQPHLEWYVGLSGILHGLLAAGVAVRLPGRDVESWIIAAVVTAKIGYEQLAGPLPGSEVSAGGPVIVAAHLYGALSGLAAAILISVRRKASI